MTTFLGYPTDNPTLRRRRTDTDPVERVTTPFTLIIGRGIRLAREGPK